MKKTTFFIVLCTCLLFFQSCTIDQRVHRKGYHIEWNGHRCEKPKTLAYKAETSPEIKASAHQTEKVLVPEMDETSELQTENPIPASITHAKNDGASIGQSKEKQLQRNLGFRNPFEQTATLGNQPTLKPGDVDPEKPIVQRIHELALLGSMFGIIGIFVGGGMGILVLMLAILCGLIALRQINNHPEKFRGSGFAIAAILLGIVGTMLILILVSLSLVELIGSILI